MTVGKLHKLLTELVDKGCSRKQVKINKKTSGITNISQKLQNLGLCFLIVSAVERVLRRIPEQAQRASFLKLRDQLTSLS